ncbi:MAG: hypothetical protein AB7O26_03915 [Planctomycetaceae bacterium]
MTEAIDGASAKFCINRRPLALGSVQAAYLGVHYGMLMTSWLELLGRGLVEPFVAMNARNARGSEPWRFAAGRWGDLTPAFAMASSRRTGQRDPRHTGWNKRQRLG